MPVLVASGASLACTMGAAQGRLTVTSQAKVFFGGAPAATIQDAAPVINLASFGLCSSPANPAVVAATAAALGIFTPAPCVPAPLGVWLCGGTPLCGGVPALSGDATLTCMYTGGISVISPGQTAVLF